MVPIGTPLQRIKNAVDVEERKERVRSLRHFFSSTLSLTMTMKSYWDFITQSSKARSIPLQ